MNKNSEFKINKCRTCLNASKGLKSLTKLAYDKKQQISYAEMLKEIANINVMDSKYREMPQSICICCCRKLKTAHAFVRQTKEVNKKLWDMLTEKDITIQSDCLQETQIDIEPCLEIKLEPLEDKLKNEIERKSEGKMCVLTKNKTTEDKSKTKYETTPEEIISIKKSICCPTSTSKQELENKVDMAKSILNNSIDLSTIKSRLNSCDSDADIFKPNIEISDSDYDDDNEESLQSYDSNWLENENQSNKKKVKKKEVSDSPKDTTVDIAVPCNICNKIFVNSKALAIHQRISHIPEEQKCACTICARKFTRFCNMYKHMRTFHGAESVTLIRKPAEGENVYQCDKCPKKYARKKSLNTHNRRKHINPQKKKECDKSTNLNDNDLIKKRADNGSLCPICGSSFTSKTQLTVHIRRHTGERPFKCDLCDRAFLLATHLTSHIRLHTGEKPFKCQLCGKSFRVSGKLAQHMRSHSDERPYKCSQCERSFKYSQDLNIHMRSHTGERPYSCGVCGSAFQRYNTLRDHRMRMGHTEENTVQNTERDIT